VNRSFQEEKHMQTVEVQPRRWSRALEDFSATHEGWLVSVDILAPTLGAQHEVTNLPLLGVVAEPHSDGAVITISAAGRDGEQITHVIHAPTSVRIERTNDGIDAAMQIESAEGVTTILRLKTAARPDTVDGIVRP
jgi:hypothetical protein